MGRGRRLCRRHTGGASVLGSALGIVEVLLRLKRTYKALDESAAGILLTTQSCINIIVIVVGFEASIIIIISFTVSPYHLLYSQPSKIHKSSHHSSLQPAMSGRILILNGPNLNLLGMREPTIYGSNSLSDILEDVKKQTVDHPVQIDTFQANNEGVIVERIHRAWEDGVDFIIINPAGYTHTSVAIRDALLGVGIPFLELHLSNVHARESWRKHSYFSDKAVGVICGLGGFGYSAAVDFAIRHVSKGKANGAPKL